MLPPSVLIVYTSVHHVCEDARLLCDAYYQRSVLCGQQQNLVYINGFNKAFGWFILPVVGRSVHSLIMSITTLTQQRLI